MRIIVLVGARPNFIKIGPLMPALREAGIDAPIAHTGQHYSAALSDVFFQDLGLPEPVWWLGVGSGTHAVQTGKAMIAIEELLLTVKPDALMVIGDVNSTLSGALAAAKIGVPTVHLESGLRSGDMTMPEEINRLVTDQLSAMLLTPVLSAADNLVAEGIAESRIHFVGNIMAESLLRTMPTLAERDFASTLDLTGKDYVLATIHRPENTDHPERIVEIIRGLDEIGLPVVMPVHPRTRAKFRDLGLDTDSKHLVPIAPVGYLDMLTLQRDATVIVTDSGGVQEESCLLGTPCVTVRRNTERQITVELGSNRLASANAGEIIAAVADALDSPRGWEIPEYWDTHVSERIVAALEGGIVPLGEW